MKNDQSVPADLLKAATTVPSGIETVDYNPEDKTPTMAVGRDFKEGMTISGYFEAVESIASRNFKYAKSENHEGVPVEQRYVLRIGSPTGKRLGIWSKAGLAKGLKNLAPGTFVSITYKGKGTNEKGNPEHLFDFKIGSLV